MTTLADIAREAGVSINLVSYVLKKKEAPNSEKHKRILEIAERLNYVPNRAASALITGRTNNITLIIAGDYYTTLREAYFSEFLNIMTHILTGLGMGLILYKIDIANPESLKKIIFGASSDGLIWYGGPLPKDIQSIVIERDYPCVLIHNEDDIISYITIDDYTSEYRLLEYLYSNGHRKIAYANTTCAPEMPRQRAYHDFIRAKSLGYSRIIETGGDILKIKRKISVDIKTKGIDFTAVAADKDTIALAVLYSLGDNGIDVPEQVSVVGYDDLPESSDCNPQLTTIRQDIGDIAKTATHYLINKRNNPKTAKSFRKKYIQDMIIRQSVKELNNV